jgi:hypothetical protein
MIWKDISYENYVWDLELRNLESLGLILSTDFEDAEKTLWTSESLISSTLKQGREMSAKTMGKLYIHRYGVYKYTRNEINCAANAFQSPVAALRITRFKH